MKFIASFLVAAVNVLQVGSSFTGTRGAIAPTAGGLTNKSTKETTTTSSTSGTTSSKNIKNDHTRPRSLSNQSCSPLDTTEGANSDNGYSTWLMNKASGLVYDNYLYVPTKESQCNGMALHWSIVDDEKIQVGVAVKTTPGNDDGWVGLGFTETGGMKGADLVYYESKSQALVDAHVGDGYMQPMEDKIQDWTLVHSEKTDDGFVIFEAERNLVLRDTNQEDTDIVDDSDIYVADHKIIGAWGDTANISFHRKNVVQQAVQLFGGKNGEAGNGKEIFNNDMVQRADGFVILNVNDFLIPTDETTYEDVCFTVDDLVNLGLYEDKDSSTHIIGFEYVVGDSVSKYVHHMLVEGHLTDLNPKGDSCDDWSRRTVGGWAPGEDIFYFPEGTGLEVGNVPNTFNSLTLQIHYDNIDGDTGKIDNGTGVKIYYTRQSVENEIGMAIMGDALLTLSNLNIGNGKTRHDIKCPSSCTEDTFDVDEVTVVAEFQHMHAKGKRMVSSLLSENGDDQELVNKATIEYWDFDQSGFANSRQKPYKWKKGDSYATTCYYDSADDTVFGLASADEMCMTFLYYYPKQPRLSNCSPLNFFDASCSARYVKTTLDPDSNFNREFRDKNIVEPEPSDDDDDPSAATTTIIHGFSIFTVSLLMIWLQH